MSNNTEDKPRLCDLETWLQILGHCNKFDVIKSEGVVKGMKISNKNDFDCTSCTLGKMTSYRNKHPDEGAKSKMELIHVDLSGAVGLRK